MTAPLRGWLIAAPGLLFLAVMLAWPLARALLEAGIDWGVWGDPYFVGRLRFTVWQAALSALSCALLAVPLGYLLARYRFRGTRTLLSVLLLPFVTPTLVAAMGLLALFGPRGLTPFDLSGTWVLIVLGHVFFNLPVVLRLSHAGFARLPAGALAAARSLGASPLRAFFTVALPVAAPAVLAGTLLAFLYSALSFGLPLTLGGQAHATLEVEVYTLAVYEFQLPAAAALIAGQLAFTVAAVLLYTRLAGARGGQAAAEPTEAPPPGARLLTHFLVLLTLLICFAPLLAVVLRSFWGGAGFTLGFWRGIVDDLPLLLGNAARFGALGLGLSLALALPLAYGAYRARSRALDALSLLPLVVSPVSLGVGYLLAYPALAAELPLLIAAYALLALPLLVRSLLPALRELPTGAEDAARTLGASPLWRLRTVTGPLTLPAVRGGAALALATILGEFGATLVLTRPEWATLSTGIFERLGRPGAQNLGEAAALATVLLLLSLLAFRALGGRGEVT